MRICERCEIKGDEKNIFDVIYNGKLTFLCGRCAIIENVPIIKAPEKAIEKEKNLSVYERMKRLSGIKEKKERFSIYEELKKLESIPKIQEKKTIELIEHFNWELVRARRRKGLSQEQLAEMISEKTEVIEMLENSIIPENSDKTIEKIEKILNITLKKPHNVEKKIPVLLNKNGIELEKIPEPGDKKIDLEKQLKELEIQKDSQQNLQEEIEESGIVEDDEGGFDIEKSDLSKIKIKDLKDFYEKKKHIFNNKKVYEKENNKAAKEKEIKEKHEKLYENLGGIELLKKEENKPETEELF